MSPGGTGGETRAAVRGGVRLLGKPESIHRGYFFLENPRNRCQVPPPCNFSQMFLNLGTHSWGLKQAKQCA